MSLHGFAQPLQIELHASPLLTAYIFILFVTTWLALALLDTVWWLQLLLSIPVILTIIQALRLHAWRLAPAALVCLRWDAAGNWHGETRAGNTLLMDLLPDSYWHARLVVLNFRVQGKRRSVVLLPDMLEAPLFRRLRVRLLLQGSRSNA